MARINAMRTAALATFCLCVSGLAHAADAPVLSLVEQSGMDRVLLRYMAEHPGNCLSSDDFDCYVALQGQVPSQQFLDAVGARAGKLKPWSDADAAKADPRRNFIGSGHNALRLNIGGFSMIAPGMAHATVREQCGAVLCGSISTATLKKTNGRWSVDSLKVDVMQ